MNPLLKLIEHGQSYWMDELTRSSLLKGELKRRVEAEGLRGVTSNPKLFCDAITKNGAYEEQIRQATLADRIAVEIYEDLVVSDIQQACDVLRPVYDSSQQRDGFVCLEVSPYLAHDSQASVEEARHLVTRVGRPNLMIKVPGTRAGIAAMQELVFEGINVNVTLLFSVDRYIEVAHGYLQALERRRDAALPLDTVHSVASFFLSRIDVLVDELLSHRMRARGSTEPRPDQLLGKAAIANARLAYQSFKAIIATERWAKLERASATRQRLLWASTGTKNPKYSDLMYVEPLIGRDTVNTMPAKTIAAFAKHGAVADTLEQTTHAARQVMSDLERLGIRFELVTEQLENEGIQKFIEPYALLIETLDEKRRGYASRTKLKDLADMAQKLRSDVIQMTSKAGSGHATSCLSCAELVAALFFHQMRWDPSDPKARNVDQFVLSKGHAAPILWAALAEAGAIKEDLLSLRQMSSTLEGHPTAENPWVRVATGSLGQGLSFANGLALANRMDGIEAKIYCLLGDAECSEGSVWEAAQFASLERLSNLVALIDVNALGQSGPAPYRGDSAVFEKRFAAFGWRTITIDGHDMAAVIGALERASNDRPTAVIASTTKGKGVSFLEGEAGWHGKALDQDQMRRALAEIGETNVRIPVHPHRINALAKGESPLHRDPIAVEYERDAKVATRSAFGNALRKLGAIYPELVVLDGDVKDSTRAEHFAESYPERFVECYIAEQNMSGVALGLARSGKIACAATFSCFLSRSHDFIRMASYSQPEHLVFCGSHAGVSVGEDGPSQMGLEDLAIFRSVLGSTVLYPCDAVSAERLTEQAMQAKGIVYLRTTRPNTAILYANNESFPIGGSKVLRASASDRLTIVAAGITVHESLKALEALAGRGIAVRLIDAYSVKPIDAETIRAAARETQMILVVEDHVYEGGLGDAVCSAVRGIARVERLAVAIRPHSGSANELLDACGISHRAIAECALTLLA